MILKKVSLLNNIMLLPFSNSDMGITAPESDIIGQTVDY